MNAANAATATIALIVALPPQIISRAGANIAAASFRILARDPQKPSFDFTTRFFESSARDPQGARKIYRCEFLILGFGTSNSREKCGEKLNCYWWFWCKWLRLWRSHQYSQLDKCIWLRHSFLSRLGGSHLCTSRNQFHQEMFRCLSTQHFSNQLQL